MMKILGITAFTLSFIGCASAPAPQGVQAADAPKKPLNYAMIAHNVSEYAGSSKCSAPSKGSVYSDWLKLAATCAGVAQWSRVEELGNKMSIAETAEPWGAYFLSLAAEGTKDHLRARFMAELAVKKSPNEGIVIYQLGRVQWAMDEREAAIVTFQKAADKNPSLVEAHVFLGNIALLADKVSDAKKSFTTAFDKEPKNFGALMGLSEVAVRKNSWPEADKYLHAAVSVQPNSSRAWLALAQAQELLGKDSEGALDSYTRIQKLMGSHKLDGTPSMDLNSKVHALQAVVAETKARAREQALKQKVSERKPSADGKATK